MAPSGTSASAARRDRGEPALGSGTAAPYVDYGSIDTLLSLQRTRSGQPAETTFLIATQVMELLFTLLRHEWVRARDAMAADEPVAALAALRRSTRVQDVLVSSWDLLADLTPAEFAGFRDHLGEASGFQSFAYRELEFLLGNTSAAMVRPHEAAPETAERLRAALREPGLYDAALALLHRRGLPVPRERLDRDRTRPYRPHPGVERAWLRVYTGGRYAELRELAEALLDVAQRVTRWRRRHLDAVRRCLGAKPGTGGSSGAEWLRRSADADVFPELWSVRDHL